MILRDWIGFVLKLFSRVFAGLAFAFQPIVLTPAWAEEPLCTVAQVEELRAALVETAIEQPELAPQLALTQMRTGRFDEGLSTALEIAGLSRGETAWLVYNGAIDQLPGFVQDYKELDELSFWQRGLIVIELGRARESRGPRRFYREALAQEWTPDRFWELHRLTQTLYRAGFIDANSNELELRWKNLLASNTQLATEAAARQSVQQLEAARLIGAMSKSSTESILKSLSGMNGVVKSRTASHYSMVFASRGDFAAAETLARMVVPETRMSTLLMRMANDMAEKHPDKAEALAAEAEEIMFASDLVVYSAASLWIFAEGFLAQNAREKLNRFARKIRMDNAAHETFDVNRVRWTLEDVVQDCGARKRVYLAESVGAITESGYWSARRTYWAAKATLE